jgi:hypothetical protein
VSLHGGAHGFDQTARDEADQKEPSMYLRKIIRRGAYSVAVAALLAGPALAHHSGAMFDSSKTVELTGTVKDFQWTNPHTWIQLSVSDANGQRVEWSIEGGSPGTLSRSGWRPSTFSAGKQVSIKVHPMLNGAPSGSFVGAKFEDGSTLGRWEDQDNGAE